MKSSHKNNAHKVLNLKRRFHNVIIKDFPASINRLSESEIIEQIADLEEPNKLNTFVKRSTDIFFSALLIICLSPILLVSAIGIKLFMGGPILYKEKRIGYKGKEFDFYKFRTMVENANDLKCDLLKKNEMGGPFFKIKNDPRVTKLGKLLRKLSLDELPQLFLVLKGDMSLIGPRPPQVDEYLKLKQWQRQAKTTMKPGISCIWQTSGRNLIKDHNEWMRLDFIYVKNWSLWLDFKIFLKTIPAVLSGIGAS